MQIDIWMLSYDCIHVGIPAESPKAYHTTLLHRYRYTIKVCITKCFLCLYGTELKIVNIH